jgi:serine/threonine protein kinase
MILKYYPDGSLHEWIHKNSTNKMSKLKIIKEVAQALKTMHPHHLAHCDLKLQNILVEVISGVPSCFLTDFGITQILSEQIIAARMFNVVNLKGLSIHFAAPEAFANFRTKKYQGVDFKMYDIYSFGCVVYEVITVKTPWSRSSGL